MENDSKVEKIMNPAIEAARKEIGPFQRTPLDDRQLTKAFADMAIDNEKGDSTGVVIQDLDGKVMAVSGGTAAVANTANDAVGLLYTLLGLDNNGTGNWQKQESAEKDEYTLKEVSERTGFSERTLQRRMKDNLLHAEMKNGKYIISNEELKRFINGHPKYKKRLEKKDVQHARQLMSQKEDLIDKATMELNKHPENVKLVIESYEIENDIITKKLKQLQLQMKIYKDHQEILKKIKEEAYEYGARRVKIQNSLNSLKFYNGPTPIFDETDKL